MINHELDRRRFLRQAAAGVGALSAGLALAADERQGSAKSGPIPSNEEKIVRKDYKGPNVILVRFGGGVRRLETIASPEKTYCPFVYPDLYTKRGMLFC